MTRWQIIKVLLIVAYRVLVKRDYLGLLRDLVPVAPTETSPLKHHPAAMKFSPELRKMVRGGGVQLLAVILLAGSAIAAGQITVTGFPPVPVTIKGGDGISIAGGVITATGVPAGGVSDITFKNYTTGQKDLNAAQDAATAAAAGVAGSALQPGDGGVFPADSLPTISAQITAANAAGGGVVLIASGSYVGNWVLPDNVTFRGTGSGTILKATVGVDSPVIELGNNSRIENLVIDGDSANQTGFSVNRRGITATSKTGNRITDVEIKYTDGSGILLWDSTHWALTKVRIHHTTTATEEPTSTSRGIHVGNSISNYGTITDCRAEYNGFDGVWIDGSEITITGGHYNYNGRGIPAAGAAGIYTREVNASHNISITGVQASYNTGFGIDLPGTLKNVTVVGNITDNNQAGGIGVFNVVGGTISGNIARNNGSNELGQPSWQLAGIIASNITGVSVTGNTAYDDQTPKTQVYGINFKGTITDSTIGPNSVSGNLTANYNYEADFANSGSIIIEGVSGTGKKIASTLGTATAGKQLVFDANGNVTASAYDAGATGGGGGTVTSVTSANADIGVSTGTTTPVLTLNSGTTANQIVKLDSSARLPGVSGALLTALPTNLNIGVGIAPSVAFHAKGASPTMRLEHNTGSTSKFDINKVSDAVTLISNQTAAGQSYIQIDPVPLDTTSDAYFRVFRGTNTSGLVYMDFFKGDNTTTSNSRISGSGNTYFAANNGTVSVGTSASSEKLGVNGAVSLFNMTAATATTDKVKVFNVEGDYLHILDEDSNDATIGQKTLSLGAASGGTATLQSTSHATKGLLTIPNDVVITGTINNPALIGTATTTMNTATEAYADVSVAGAAAITVTNVVAGRVFTIKVTSSGGGAISFVTLTPTWEGSAPATVTATKSTRIVCLGTGANAALCSVAKENF